MNTLTLSNDSRKQEPENSKQVNDDSGCEISPVTSEKSVEKTFKSIATLTLTTDRIKTEDDDDIVILRRDCNGKTNLNKSAYAKLHHTVSPSRNTLNVDYLKEKYEETKSANENLRIPTPQLQTIKLDNSKLSQKKQGSTTFGYSKSCKPSKLPQARPRSSIKSQIALPQRNKLRYSLQIDKKLTNKDENSNDVDRKNSSSSGEFVTIIRRSESEASVDKFEKELNLFMMDPKAKEKKRSNSFRKIFSGKIFGKDKKKKEDENRPAYKENVSNSANMQNESNSFNRQSPYRHTTVGIRDDKVSRQHEQVAIDPYKMREIEQRYAKLHVQEFHHIKQNFENQRPALREDYVTMDKPLITNTPGPTNYMNMPNVRKYIDTSSSASTLESEGLNIYQNGTITKQQEDKFENLNSIRRTSKETSRDTPPRAQELRQDVRLVNPKALIPINSERPLPNPYHNGDSSSLEKPKISPKPNLTNIRMTEGQTTDTGSQPKFEETYGTVFDSLQHSNERKLMQKTESTNLEIPRSPSFEPEKLKLPPNREIVPLSPRVRSPIPHDNISTEKMIATELLKHTRSPTPTKKNSKTLSPSHQKLEIGIDYPDNINNEQNERRFETNALLTTKPPLSRVSLHKAQETWSPSKQRISQYSPAFDNKRSSPSSPAFENRENNSLRQRMSQASPVVDQEKVITNAMVHVNSSNTRTPTPNSLSNYRSMSPMRITPVDMKLSPSTKSQSPQKEDMRRSVEAFYWKEIKKLKEQENMDLYYYHMNLLPYGYVENPVNMRRSRSLSPSSHRNSRRSLSLPRDPKPVQINHDVTDAYGRIQRDSIPEGRAVINRINEQYDPIYYQQNFRRNAPERRTVDGVPKTSSNYNHNSLYRPIFKRGSLTTPVKELVDDQQNKKVSFSSGRDAPQSITSWPTRNGFTQSPPQRRMENRNNSLDDDVFLPNHQQTSKLIVDGKEIYGYANKPFNPEYYPRQPIPQRNMYQPNMQYRHQMHQEPLYGVTPTPSIRHYPQEALYGQPFDAIRYPLTRHGSIQFQERQQMRRKMSYDPNQVMKQPRPLVHTIYSGPKREIIMKDDIFGQFGDYLPNEDPYGYTTGNNEPTYGYSRQPKQVIVNNQVCDMFGQIHDSSSPSLSKKSGVILGQLRSSPQATRHLSHENFQRNTRLTASANDMYRRYQNMDPRYRSDVVYEGRYQQENAAPTRPLPPVPTDKRRGRADVETASDASDIQKVNTGSNKSKKRGLFGGKNTLRSPLETEETKHMSTPKLQRLVLLEQLHLIRMQTESENLKRRIKLE